MVVQRVDLKRGDRGNAEVVSNTWYVSADSGKTWKHEGVVDPTDQKAVLAPRSVISHGETTYSGAYSRKDGMALYVSEDDCRSWQRRLVDGTGSDWG